MMRILFWVALIVLVIAAIRSKIRGKLRDMTPPPGQPGPGARAHPIRELGATIECAHCHVYFPESEAVTADGRAYCSSEHAHQPHRPG
ncbi:hypothetical protein HF313_29390 [Massilia atriviolacea]|uniref:Deaminase n=1 Tax=Massilia atriviolacea TaxID=2495579 RepID=A0A430HCB0_9BURK|nr:PP0621 family protein [Massilia atriviolacea]RSZ55142.1 hypothetical protein EJB06_31005 [Massilia atriviolacea]